MSGGSYNDGKKEVCAWIRDNFPRARILDVGPGSGTWRDLLPEHRMDAVEIFAPTVEEIKGKYDAVICADIADVSYDYDLVIFGDVIEHMTVEKAQKVIEYARQHSRDFIIAVPWRYKQGVCYGNQWEVHIQDDLTPEIFAERYPGMIQLWANERYAYYHDGSREVL